MLERLFFYLASPTPVSRIYCASIYISVTAFPRASERMCCVVCVFICTRLHSQLPFALTMCRESAPWREGQQQPLFCAHTREADSLVYFLIYIAHLE